MEIGKYPFYNGCNINEVNRIQFHGVFDADGKRRERNGTDRDLVRTSCSPDGICGLCGIFPRTVRTGHAVFGMSFFPASFSRVGGLPYGIHFRYMESPSRSLRAGHLVPGGTADGGIGVGCSGFPDSGRTVPLLPAGRGNGRSLSRLCGGAVADASPQSAVPLVFLSGGPSFPGGSPAPRKKTAPGRNCVRSLSGSGRFFIVCSSGNGLPPGRVSFLLRP